MTNPATQPWERQPKEPDLWFGRFRRFLQLGPARSLIALYRLEEQEKRLKRRRAKAREGARFNVPGAWLNASHKWQWRERAAAWDDAERQKRDELYAARQNEILESGFAARFTRVAELNRLAELLLQELWTEDKRWLPDVKWIGGEFGERVDIVRFNARLIEQFRQTLDDIAVEMGERVEKLKLSGNLGIVQFAADELAQAKAAAEQAEKELAARIQRT